MSSPEQPKQHARPTQPQERERKRRRRRRGRGLFGALTYILFVVGVSALLAVVGWEAANDVLALNKEEHSAVITVEEDTSFSEVVNRLKENNIIDYKLVFRIFAACSNGEEKIVPGTYSLTTEMDYRAIINNMSARSASRQKTTVTIPEGYTVEQIFALLDAEGVSTEEKLRDMAASHNYAFSFLQHIPLGDHNRLEGYLFPDTYEFYMGENPLYAINKMLVNFDARVTDEMRQTISDGGSTVADMVIIASLIEKETTGDDQALISSVIHNRLNNPGGEHAGYLNIDATVQYALEERKERLSYADLEVDSPYNTYRYKGLPPGPIANPGMAAIRAAMNPEESNYYFYALGDDDAHHFFRTYQGLQDFLATVESR